MRMNSLLFTSEKGDPDFPLPSGSCGMCHPNATCICDKDDCKCECKPGHSGDGYKQCQGKSR